MISDDLCVAKTLLEASLQDIITSFDPECDNTSLDLSHANVHIAHYLTSSIAVAVVQDVVTVLASLGGRVHPSGAVGFSLPTHT